MHTAQSSKLLLVVALLTLLFIPLPGQASVSSDEAAKLLPDHVGDARARSGPLPSAALSGYLASEGSGIISAANRDYSGGFKVTLFKTRSDSAAYALLTYQARQLNPPSPIQPNYIGTAAIDSPQGVIFFKGPVLVNVQAAKEPANREALLSFARLLADTLDKGEGEIPVLVKHLPEWEQAQASATYAVDLKALQEAAGNRPALDAISFEGGTEAVTSTYGPARLIIVEYTTPQIATDSDAHIAERIRQLQAEGQAVPSAYRRVGNYSVFVFDAPDEKTATQLIERINYEQVVQWLGDNPRLLELAQRHYADTTAGVIVAVLKASGLALVLCFGVGAIFGALIFRRRRAQQRIAEAYSDAGGMLRLNIDEMTAQTDPARLLGRGES